MYDLDTIKRLNRNPSKRSQPGNRQDKPAPQPGRMESLLGHVRTQATLLAFKRDMQSPAMKREPLDHA